MNKDLMFSSATDKWETPQDFFDLLDNEYFFHTDVSASEDNAKCSHYFTEDQDGLKQEWKGFCWMNPPYGRKIGEWIKKAHEETLKHSTVVVCLLPARTCTKWFHDYCAKYGEVFFVRGRLKFGGSKNAAPFPSMVVVFGSSPHGAKERIKRALGDRVS
jgi:phage N-6-adenine-methyltransferase